MKRPTDVEHTEIGGISARKIAMGVEVQREHR